MHKSIHSWLVALSLLGAAQAQGKELPLSYVRENIHKFLEGKTLFFAPLRTAFKVCYRRVGYDHDPAQSTTEVKETNYPLSPTIYMHFRSYQMFSVQRAHEERIDLIGICPIPREDMIPHR